MANYKIDLIRKCNSLMFDANEVCELRKNERICGHLTGSLANSARQNVFFGVPLLVSNEEAKLLESHQVADIFERSPNNCLNESLLAEINKDHDNYLRKDHQNQLDFCKQKRLKELNTLKDKIIIGKRKKIQSKIDATNKEETLSDAKKPEELSKLKMELDCLENTVIKEQQDKINKDFASQSTTIQFNVELHVKTPEYLERTSNASLCNEKFLTITPELDYKYFIYEYLWSRGFYLTSGAKFGGHYLVYSGDPLRYHSSFILLCIRNRSEFEAIRLRQLITFGRLATNVKKTYLIAYCDKNGGKLNRILFTCINWAHI